MQTDNLEKQRCRCCSSNRLKWSGLMVSVMGLILIGFATFLPSYIQQQIHDGIVSYQVLDQQSANSNADSFVSWSDWTSSSAQAVSYTVHVFNVSNAADVEQHGAHPIVHELGPYIFREYKQRFNITWYTDDYGHGCMKYREWLYYVFDPLASAPYTLNDTVIVPDLVFQGLVSMANSEGGATGLALQFIVKKAYGSNPRLFTQQSVNGILFGYNDPVLESLSSLGIPPWFPGLIGNQTTIPLNISFDAIFTGEFGEVERARSMFQSKGMPYLLQQADPLDASKLAPLWSTPEANRVRGTDANSFRPFLPTNDAISQSGSSVAPTRLETFVSDLNRTVYVVHSSNVDLKGIHLQRYIIDPSILLNATLNPANTPFQMFGASGVINLTACQTGVPIFVTKPHLLDVSSSVADLVDGLHPNREVHDTFLDVEPISGVMMNGAKRLQINVNFKPVHFSLGNVTWFEKVNPSLLSPAAWMEEAGTISDDQAADFRNTVYLLSDFARISTIAFFVGGGVMVLVAVFLFFVSVQRSNLHSRSLNSYDALPGEPAKF